MSAAKELLKVLGSLGESSRFCGAGAMTPILPGLAVKGVGVVGMPVSPADAARLIGKASTAPYGRGEETIVDTSIRNVWQLEPKQFSLRNAEWEAFLAGIVEAVKNELGIRRKVEHRL